MSEIGEALGTATEGGLFARVLGRKQGASTQPADEASADCLNCGGTLQGNYCHICGQKAHIHRSISGIMHDLLHGVLHLDGKLWNTLPLLVFKPGKLTREYIEGKRARHVSPMAMFLFSVFLMFAVFQALGITTPTDFKPTDALGSKIEGEQAQLEGERAGLKATLNALPKGDPDRAEIEARVSQIDEDLAGIGKASEVMVFDASDGDKVNITGIPSIDQGIIKKWRENPSLMLYKLQNNSYKFSWLLIPLSVPFVWLLFLWRRQYKAYDHAIFVTYSLAFMSLLFITLSLINAAGIGLELVALAGMLIPPVHLYKQLRYTYNLSRFSAFWRLMALSLFIWIVVILFLQALLLLGAS